MLRVVVPEGTEPPRPSSSVPKASSKISSPNKPGGHFIRRSTRNGFAFVRRGECLPGAAGLAGGGAEGVCLSGGGGLPGLEAAPEAGAEGAVGDGLDGGEGDGGEHQHARQLLPRCTRTHSFPPPAEDTSGRRRGGAEEEGRHRAGGDVGPADKAVE